MVAISSRSPEPMRLSRSCMSAATSSWLVCWLTAWMRSIARAVSCSRAARRAKMSSLPFAGLSIALGSARRPSKLSSSLRARALCDFLSSSAAACSSCCTLASLARHRSSPAETPLAWRLSTCSIRLEQVSSCCSTPLTLPDRPAMLCSMDPFIVVTWFTAPSTRSTRWDTASNEACCSLCSNPITPAIVSSSLSACGPLRPPRGVDTVDSESGPLSKASCSMEATREVVTATPAPLRRVPVAGLAERFLVPGRKLKERAAHVLGEAGGFPCPGDGGGNLFSPAPNVLIARAGTGAGGQAAS
mmetsp:Transcript_1732/g.4152  ORF Transcript_1732/g.4152 Transcript_1732/m.4152 type:complete len:302 (-) Transcript_1732:69-974(-)